MCPLSFASSFILKPGNTRKKTMRIFILMFAFILLHQGIGAQAPVLLKEIVPGATDGLPTGASSTGQAPGQKQLHFAFNQGSVREYWRTDGTPAGTVRLFTYLLSQNNAFTPTINGEYFIGDLSKVLIGEDTLFVVGPGDLQPKILHRAKERINGMGTLGSDFYFVSSDSLNKNANFWRFTPTTEALTKIARTDCIYCAELSWQMPSGPVYINSETNNFFDPNPTAFYRYDAATQKFVKVGPIDAAPVSDASLLSANFLPPDRKTLYFWSNPVKDTRRLWAYKDDTQKLTLIGEYKYGAIGLVSPRFQWNGKLFYLAPPPDKPDESRLYVTDGTAEGTQMLDFLGGKGVEASASFTAFKNKLYFIARPKGLTTQYNVYATDGTAAGTALAIDPTKLGGGNLDFNAVGLTTSGDSLYFSAKRTEYGQELWVSDGSTSGTRVLDAIQGTVGSEPILLLYADKNLIFRINNKEATDKELAVLNTTTGTLKVWDLSAQSSSEPQNFMYHMTGNYLVFTAKHPDTGRELWVYRPGSVSAPELLNGAMPGFELTPNPAVTTVRVTADPEQPLERIEVFNLQGQLQWAVSRPGAQQVEIPVAGWPAGTYVVKVQAGNKVAVRKMAVH